MYSNTLTLRVALSSPTSMKSISIEGLGTVIAYYTCGTAPFSTLVTEAIVVYMWEAPFTGFKPCSI